jgi:hypothetical protein
MLLLQYYEEQNWSLGALGETDSGGDIERGGKWWMGKAVS